MGLMNAVRDMRTIKQLLTTAEAEARSGGEELPGPEHLLLAATALPDGSATRALEQVGVTPHQLREAVVEVHRSALAAVGIDVDVETEPAFQSPATGAMRSTPQGQRVFHEAVALSKSTRPSVLTGAHVVVAVCTLERGTAVRALARLGVDPDRLRAAACAEAGLSAL
ncbi:Clp protease N-terminal domain-containing protein [Nocardioides pacificus]